MPGIAFVVRNDFQLRQRHSAHVGQVHIVGARSRAIWRTGEVMLRTTIFFPVGLDESQECSEVACSSGAVLTLRKIDETWEAAYNSDWIH